MGFNILLPILIGTSISIVLAAQIGPKVVETKKVEKIETKVIDTQDVIFEATKRYITMKQKIPTDINELINSGFLAGKYNDNGFGGNFEISIDEIKGILNVYTSIEDERAQTIFLNSIKNKANPKKEGLNDFVTSFVLPLDVIHGNGLFMAGIPTQKEAPDSTKYKYWFDTSNGEAILKMFDGEDWVTEKNGKTINYENIAKNFDPTIKGNIKYVYDSTTDTLQEFVYENNEWKINQPNEGDIKYSYDGNTNSIREFVYENNQWVTTNPIDGDKKYAYDNFTDTIQEFVYKNNQWVVNYPEIVFINGHKYKKDNDGKLVLATVGCYGMTTGQTIKVEGVDYIVVDGGSGTYGIKNSFNRSKANTYCTSNVTDMSNMNFGTSFNVDISKWDTKRVTSMNKMFYDAYSFNQDISNWDVSNVKNMSYMFENADSFNQPLNDWDVSKVQDMLGMFSSYMGSSFNQPLNNWDVSNVKDISYMFSGAYSFNQPLNNWNVSNVKNMEKMFARARLFNQPLNEWDVSNVTNMGSMFVGAFAFNQNINSWNTSNVKNMQGMFSEATSFNQPLNDWNVSKVTSFGYYNDADNHIHPGMFNRATSFNQPLNNWIINTTDDVTMTQMFYNAYVFNQNISNWNVSKVNQRSGFDTGAGSWQNEYKPIFP